MFTLVGGHISPILVACQAAGIRVVDTRHEVSAVFAADAMARLGGVPGVVAVTAGPGQRTHMACMHHIILATGLTNTVTAVKNAQMAESPLLLIGGAAASLLKARHAHIPLPHVQRSGLRDVVPCRTSTRCACSSRFASLLPPSRGTYSTCILGCAVASQYTRRVKDIVPVLRQALAAAQSGVPGPVFVEFPIDTLYPYASVVKEIAAEVGLAMQLQSR